MTAAGAAAAETVEVWCAACPRRWRVTIEVPGDDLLAEKVCPSCGLVFRPVIQDYSGGRRAPEVETATREALRLQGGTS